MITHPDTDNQELPATDFGLLNKQLRSLISGVPYAIANLANAASLLYNTLPCINWAGFYLLRDGKLTLGPFMGKPACTELFPGRGVCGTAVQEKRTIVVPDVHSFAGHIACDSASNSEIVIPLSVRGELYGVLDIDSPEFDRFSAEDKEGLEAFAAILAATL